MTPRDGNLVETVKLPGSVGGQEASNQRLRAWQIGMAREIRRISILTAKSLP